MKPGIQTLVVVLTCAIVLALYFALGKSKLDAEQDRLSMENDNLASRLVAIRAKQVQIPKLIEELPYWQKQLEVFRASMPQKIEDERFLAAIATEFSNNKVELLGVELAPGGPWLGKLSEDQRLELEGIGVDVKAAQAVKTANYTIRMNGSYGDILRAMEGLKRYGRMYTVDEFAGPAGGGAGQIVETVSQENTPIMVSGKIYYGLPQSKVTPEEVVRVIEQVRKSPPATSGQDGGDTEGNPAGDTARTPGRDKNDLIGSAAK
jgi:Tfp pilus assembly protein PilO